MKRKTVLITGASRGIGKAIALRFASSEYNIVVNCVKNSTLLLQLKSEIEQHGVDCLAFVGDIGNYDTACQLYKEATERFGGIDIVVNNAGISIIGLLSDLSADEWNRILQTNLSSVFHCSKLALPHMIHNKWGKIINISSVWGNVGASCEVAYSTTKGGINAFTKALAKELAPSGIQVNAIACGTIDTEMNGFLSKEERDMLTEEIPAGRFGKPEEVAHLCFQLCEGNDYLTGQIITLDGGWI